MAILIKGAMTNLPKRQKVPDTRHAKLVLQAEFGIVSAGEQPRLIKTMGYGECVVLALMEPSRNVGGLAHFDIKTLVKDSIDRVILPEFTQRGCRSLRAQLIGGMASAGSIGLARAIKDVMNNNRIKIQGIEINGPDRPAGLLLDPLNSRLYDIERPLVPDDPIISQRREDALKYIMANPQQRLLRLVK